MLKKAFLSLIIVLPVLMVFMSLDYSSSGDENIQIRQAKNVLEYFYSGGEKDAALKPRGNNPDHFYGSSFDVITQAGIRLLNVEDYYLFRHVLNAITGAIIIVFIGLFGRLLKDNTTGIIAMILAFLSPRLLGHSFNNPKDIPFALGIIMSLYFMAKWLLNFKDISKKDILFLILSIAFTNSIRIGGMLLYGYLGLFLAVKVLTTSGLKNIFQYKKQIITAIIVVVSSYFLGLILWPFGLVNPLKNPFEALAGFEKFAIGISQLFEGNYVDSKSLPKHYLTKYILITTPVLILLGFIVFLFKQVTDKTWRNNIAHYLLLFSIVFPLAYIVYKNSNVYGGWRQVLFVYPPIVVLSSLGIRSLFSIVQKKFENLKWLPWAALSILLIHPIKHIIKNHPYEYIYFNEAFGGVENAYAEYELDYYYHSTREGALWLKNHIKSTINENDTIQTMSNHSDYNYYLKDDPQIRTGYSRYYDRYQHDWEYYVSINNYINPHQLKYNHWPPKGTIHTIDVDGKPICAIIKRPSKNDYEGYKMLKKNKFNLALPYFLDYLKVDPTNCSVLAATANACIGLGRNDEAIKYAKTSLKYYKNYPTGLDMLGRAYLNKRQFDNAISTYNTLAKSKPNYFLAYYFQSICYFNKKDYKTALQKAQLCLRYKGDFKPMFKVVGQIKEAQGDIKGAQQFYAKAK